MKVRSNYWDNFKGILIFLVVIGHFLYAYKTSFSNNLAGNIVTFIYLFHMPAFIYTTGFLSRSENCYKLKSYLKLLICFVIFNTSIVIFDYFLNGSSISVIVPKYSYWYLLSVIFWRLLIRPLSNIRGILPLSILISLLIGFYPDINNTFSIVRTLAFFPFFIFGYKYDLKLLKDKIEAKKALKMGILLFAIGSAVLGFYVACKFNISSSTLLYYSYKKNQDLVIRLALLFVSFISIVLLALNIPKKKMSLVTRAGKYSLLIYLVHRPITLLFSKVFSFSNYSNIYILYSFIATVLVLIIFSNKGINELFNRFLNYMTMNARKALSMVLIILLMLLSIKPGIIVFEKIFNNSDNLKKEEKIEYNRKEDLLDNTTKISYVGDLILLKDQVLRSYDEKNKMYNFDYMFANTKKYFSSVDYSFGVLEGPVASAENGYSTSNYGDGVKIYQNYPKDFLSAIKKSGIDFVTTANNHMLDMKEEGVYDTIDALKEKNMSYIGTYKDAKDKRENNVKIVKINDIRIAVLSYTIASNYYDQSYFFETNPNISSILVNPNSKYYQQAFKDVENDFKKAKSKNPDLILVMAHMGTQFTHKTNNLQEVWNENFKYLGANVILGDHSHSVQPIEYEGGTLIVNCPGNFANSYLEADGDATSIVEFYIDNETKKVVGYSVVPMFTQELSDGKFTAMPIYDYYRDRSNDRKIRIEEVQRLVTKVMLNQEIGVNNLQEKYYKIDKSYLKKYEEKQIENENLVDLIEKSKKITFIGDSITEGTRNGKHPWYENLMDSYKNKEVKNISRGSLTLRELLLDYEKSILDTKSDLYIVSIGANDIRYRNDKICSITKEDYITNMKKLVNLIKKSNKKANIVLIAPWISFEYDFATELSLEEKNSLYKEYSKELKSYADRNNYLYIDANFYIKNNLKYRILKDYLNDAIHPNANDGINLYSEAVLYSK